MSRPRGPEINLRKCAYKTQLRVVLISQTHLHVKFTYTQPIDETLGLNKAGLSWGVWGPFTSPSVEIYICIVHNNMQLVKRNPTCHLLLKSVIVWSFYRRPASHFTLCTELNCPGRTQSWGTHFQVEWKTFIPSLAAHWYDSNKLLMSQVSLCSPIYYHLSVCRNVHIRN